MLTNGTSNFFYIALLLLGAIFAVFNIWIGLKNRRAYNKDYATLYKEKVAADKRIKELEKLIL